MADEMTMSDARKGRHRGPTAISRRTLSGLRAVARSIEASHSFVLTTHHDPDGDGLGAEAALAAALRRSGKRVAIINDGPLPQQYAFLGPERLFQRYRPERHNHVIKAADVIVLLDAHEPKRTGRLAGPLSAATGGTIVIDHHPGGGWGALQVIDPDATSTTQLVARLLELLNVDLTPAMADALYTGILADTNGFSNANTSVAALQTAATLAVDGARPACVFQQVFAAWPPNRLRLQGEVLANVHTAARGRLIWSAVTREALRRLGQPSAATEGFVDTLMSSRDAKLAILFIEDPGPVVRLSIRSRAPTRADRIAKTFCGGGHALAAGARVEGSLEEVTRRVLRVARSTLRGR